jgi:circadian clock protein KaiC
MQREVAAKVRDRVSSGIEGLDGLLSGGFLDGSMIVVSGRPGTGKTLLASEFLYHGATHGEPSLYVSFAETKDQFLVNMEKFGLPFSRLIADGIFSFVDLTAIAPEGMADALDLIVSQAAAAKAKRLVIDSFTALAQAFEKTIDARITLHVVLGRLTRDLGCTTVVLTEMPFGTDKVGLGIEEFVADGIIVLDVASHKGNPRRTLGIRKMRGTEISLRPSSYEITNEGMKIFPAITPPGMESIGEKRTPTGVRGFDELVEGGLMERSVTGIVGAAGTGKTTFGIQFAYAGAKDFGDRGLFVSFSESRDQLRLVSTELGMSRLEGLEKEGKLKIATITPERSTPEGVILLLQKLLDEVKPRRVVLDDVTALEAIADEDEFYRVLNSIAKSAQKKGATVIISITTDEIAGAAITGKSVSTVMDGIVMLRYVEVEGAMERTMVVLKMRGTRHDLSIRKFMITKGGILVESALRGFTGLTSGVATRMYADFKEEEDRITAKEKKGQVDRREALEKRIRRLRSPTRTARAKT